MYTNAILAPRSPGNDAGGSLVLVSKRLRKLRRERQLVVRAIIALREVSQSRGSREKRAIRN
jgi:hypothetical protein